jgi:hypothetical protein
MYVTNPAAPSKDQARHAAERIAKALRAEMPEYQIRIVEVLGCSYEVVVEVPFRHVTLNWLWYIRCLWRVWRGRCALCGRVPPRGLGRAYCQRCFDYLVQEMRWRVGKAK